MKRILLVAALACSAYMMSATVLDRIVARVGREIILESELNQQMLQLQKLNMLTDDITRRDVLEQMVQTRLVIQKAKEENYTVDATTVRALANSQIEQIKSRFPSEQAFQEELRKAGLNIPDLRSMFEDMITEDRLKEQIIRNEIDNRIHITEAEVEEYYNENLDQFPLRPAMDEVGIISRRVKVSEITRREAMDTMQQVLEQVREGKDFAELAKQYSEGPAAKSGGDLGFFGRGMMIAEIEDVAFNLMPGQVSEVIQGPQGLYIVKVEEKRDDEVRARLIMKKLIPGDSDYEAERILMSRVLDRLNAGEPYADIAVTYSEEDSIVANGGVLGEFPPDSYPQEYAKDLKNLNYGQYSGVIQDGERFYILAKLRQVPPRPFEYLEIESELREMVRTEKQAELYDEWMKKLMKEKYVEILLEG